MYNPLRGARLEIVLCWRRKNYERCGFNGGMHFTRKIETSVVPASDGRCIRILLHVKFTYTFLLGRNSEILIL